MEILSAWLFLLLETNNENPLLVGFLDHRPHWTTYSASGPMCVYVACGGVGGEGAQQMFVE